MAVKQFVTGPAIGPGMVCGATGPVYASSGSSFDWVTFSHWNNDAGTGRLLTRCAYCARNQDRPSDGRCLGCGANLA